jgi:hypothetical protein
LQHVWNYFRFFHIHTCIPTVEHYLCGAALNSQVSTVNGLVAGWQRGHGLIL